MIFAMTRMKHLTAVVLADHSDPVTKELLRQGVMHFVNLTDIPAVTDSKESAIATVVPRLSESKVIETRRRIESFMNLQGYTPFLATTPDLKSVAPEDLERSNQVLDSLSADLQGYRDRQRVVQQEILKFEDIKRQINLFDDLGAAVKARSQFSFLDIRTGMVTPDRREAFLKAIQAFPSLTLSFNTGKTEESDSGLVLITMKQDQALVSRLLDQYGWNTINIPEAMSGAKEKKDLVDDLDRKLSGMKDEQKKLAEDVHALITGKLEGLKRMWINVYVNELLLKIQSFFKKTSHTVIFAGWLPEEKQDQLEESIRQITQNRCYLEWSKPREMEVEKKKIPVELKNPKFLSPFQMLVKNYSIPQYGSIDPTPLVAVTFLAMFGLMFGDAGHGLILALSGFCGAFLYSGKKNKNLGDLFMLIGWCGLSAVVAGILFGSYFGVQVFRPLWFDYHGAVTGHAPGIVSDIYGILVITIYFGIIVIAVGLVLNWINLVSQKKWLKLILDKGGLIGSWIFGAGVYVGFYFVKHEYRELPALPTLFWLLGLPVILIALKPPLEYFLGEKQPGRAFSVFTVIDFFMEWIVEILEIFSGYLANTLSFMRVAGLGIAHVSLMVAFFEIAAMVGGQGSFNIWSLIILIVGNILVIALEGLSAGIQSLRLNYYEFFSKYFSGSGKSYLPISLSKQ